MKLNTWEDKSSTNSEDIIANTPVELWKYSPCTKKEFINASRVKISNHLQEKSLLTIEEMNYLLNELQSISDADNLQLQKCINQLHGMIQEYRTFIYFYSDTTINSSQCISIDLTQDIEMVKNCNSAKTKELIYLSMNTNNENESIGDINSDILTNKNFNIAHQTSLAVSNASDDDDAAEESSDINTSIDFYDMASKYWKTSFNADLSEDAVVNGQQLNEQTNTNEIQSASTKCKDALKSVFKPLVSTQNLSFSEVATSTQILKEPQLDEVETNKENYTASQTCSGKLESIFEPESSPKVLTLNETQLDEQKTVSTETYKNGLLNCESFNKYETVKHDHCNSIATEFEDEYIDTVMNRIQEEISTILENLNNSSHFDAEIPERPENIQMHQTSCHEHDSNNKTNLDHKIDSFVYDSDATVLLETSDNLNPSPPNSIGYKRKQNPGVFNDKKLFSNNFSINHEIHSSKPLKQTTINAYFKNISCISNRHEESISECKKRKTANEIMEITDALHENNQHTVISHENSLNSSSVTIEKDIRNDFSLCESNVTNDVTDDLMANDHEKTIILEPQEQVFVEKLNDLTNLICEFKKSTLEKIMNIPSNNLIQRDSASIEDPQKDVTNDLANFAHIFESFFRD